MKHLLLTLDERDAAAAVEALFEALQAPPRRWWSTPVTVWLSGALARPFVFGPVAGFKGFKEAHDAAAAMAPAASGLQGSCVAYLENDPSQHGALATAVEQPLLDALAAAARARGVRLAHVRPVWALPRVGDTDSGDRLWCCRDGDALTVLARRERRWTFAATYAPAPDVVAMKGLLHRLQASMGLRDEQVVSAAVVPTHNGQPPQLEAVATEAA